MGTGLDDVEVDMEAIVSSSMGTTLLSTELLSLGSKVVGVDGAEETGVVELVSSLLAANSSISDGCDGTDTFMGDCG